MLGTHFSKHLSATGKQYQKLNPEFSYESQSHKNHHETLKFQKNSLLLLQTFDVQAMLPQSERQSGMHFLAISL